MVSNKYNFSATTVVADSIGCVAGGVTFYFISIK